MSKKALLVGIDKYPGPNALHGCVNDVTAVKALLTQKRGYKSDEITFLTDGKAKRADILEGIRWLSAGTREGDTRLFYYSGHGTRVHDATNGDEEDGWDECLVPRDYFTSDEPLIDDTLQGEYASMLAKKANLVLVMDSCHSGSVNKGPQEGSLFRFVKPRKGEARLALAAKRKAEEKMASAIQEMAHKKAIALHEANLSAKELKEDLSEFIAGAIKNYRKKVYGTDWKSTSGTGVLLTGCQDREQSEERQFGSKRHGVLTHFLLEILKAGPVSYGDLHEKLTETLDDGDFTQHPNLECKNRSAKFMNWT